MDVFNLHVEFNCALSVIVFLLSHNMLIFIHVTTDISSSSFLLHISLRDRENSFPIPKGCHEYPHTGSLLFLAIFSHGDNSEIKI